MKILGTLAKRFGRQASEEVVQVVKTEAKNVGINLIPIGIGIGMTLIWLKFFKGGSASNISEGLRQIPTISSVTTNNFFLSNDVAKDVLAKILKQGGIFYDN